MNSLTPNPEPRRKWGFTPLCGAGATFSGSSKGPSRSEERGTKGRGELVNIIYINIKKVLITLAPSPRRGRGERLTL